MQRLLPKLGMPTLASSLLLFKGNFIRLGIHLQLLVMWPCVKKQMLVLMYFARSYNLIGATVSKFQGFELFQHPLPNLEQCQKCHPFLISGCYPPSPASSLTAQPPPPSLLRSIFLQVRDKQQMGHRLFSTSSFHRQQIAARDLANI